MLRESAASMSERLIRIVTKLAPTPTKTREAETDLASRHPSDADRQTTRTGIEDAEGAEALADERHNGRSHGEPQDLEQGEQS